jgi:hypothetical protein
MATTTAQPETDKAPVATFRPDKVISYGKNRGTAQVTYLGRTHHCRRVPGSDSLYKAGSGYLFNLKGVDLHRSKH